MTPMEAMIYAAAFAARHLQSQGAKNSAAFCASEAVADFRKVDLGSLGPRAAEIYREAALHREDQGVYTERLASLDAALRRVADRLESKL